MKILFKDRFIILIIVFIAIISAIAVFGIVKNNQPAPNNEEADKLKMLNEHGLVRVQDVDPSIIIDLKYATTDNFAKRKIYPFTTCLLREETAGKLANANKILKSKGYTIKIFDAFRPPVVQEIFWQLVKDRRFIADPSRGGSIHNKGCAVDITMVNQNGEVEMPTKFDDFTEKASRMNNNISNEAKYNLDILTSAMVENGFNYIQTEWWHFDDADADKYEVIDVIP